MNDPIDLIVHVGMPKAASTSFQRWLMEQAADLDAACVAPVVASVGQAAADLRLFERGLADDSLPESVIDPLDRALAQAEERHGVVLLSTEFLSRAPRLMRTQLLRLGKDHGARVTILLAYRPASESVISAWQQAVRMGGSGTLSEHVEKYAAQLHNADAATAADVVADHWLGTGAVDLLATTRVSRRSPTSLNPLVDLVAMVLTELGRTAAAKVVHQHRDNPVRHANRSGSVEVTEVIRRLNLQGPGALEAVVEASSMRDPASMYRELAWHLERQLVQFPWDFDELRDQVARAGEHPLIADADARMEFYFGLGPRIVRAAEFTRGL